MHRMSQLAAALAAAACLAVEAAGLAQGCADIRAANPAAGDGHYIIAPADTPFVAYCHDMAGAPREYLSLAPEDNYSVGTRYARVRIHPGTLRVDVNDTTFAFAQAPGWMPYATAGSCGDSLQEGRARIDLGAHPFIVQDAFMLRGAQAVGSVNGVALDGDGAWIAVASPAVELAAAGSCGAIAPATGALQLAYVGDGVVDKDSCKDGGFALFGIFKTQGDCVAFFASNGRNFPDG